MGFLCKETYDPSENYAGSAPIDENYGFNSPSPIKLLDEIVKFLSGFPSSENNGANFEAIDSMFENLCRSLKSKSNTEKYHYVTQSVLLPKIIYEYDMKTTIHRCK